MKPRDNLWNGGRVIQCTTVAPVALQVRTPPLFAVRHCEAALQRARGRAQADAASAALKERYARDHDRATRNLIGRARP